MNDSCLFCKIIRGEIPCSKVYEDEHTLAFLDIGPIIQGHTLVVPKQHVDPITEADDHLLAQVISTAKKIAAAQMNILHADGVNIIQNNGAAAGQVVPHLHVHVIPRYTDDGHTWNWNAKSYDNMDQMTQLAEQLRQGL